MFLSSGPKLLSRPLAVLASLALSLSVLVPLTQAVAAQPAAAAVPNFNVLVISKVAGFAHTSRPNAEAAIQALGTANNFTVTVDQTADRFTAAGLAPFNAVIFNSTTGDFLNDAQQTAFENYIKAGGGFVGLHAAADAEYSWPWYNGLVGAYFESHPAQQNATIKVEDRVHPSTANLGDTWTRFDEWYNYTSMNRAKLHVLLSLDETSYTGGADGADHPIAWCQNYDGGRSWYSGLGHTEASYTETAFLSHLLGGIETAAGFKTADCGASQASSYQLVALNESVAGPMALDIAQDGSVFFVERGGNLRRVDPVTNLTTTVIAMPVALANEDGLLGIALDPNFATNNYIYVYWSPSDIAADGPHNRLSRLTYIPASKTVSLASERALLKIPTQRRQCCHAGGDLLFDTSGNLILATGDNTNPFSSSGFTPIDERVGQEDFDAQRSSGNTNDLRGKVLRITPQANGTYTVPSGNLFAAGTALTRPEIYAMGFRNPFRIGIDPKTNNIMVADYGPDSRTASSTRGPDGRVEWNMLTGSGNYGWPYCHSNTCYNDYNFATSASGAVFSASAPVNNSPNNTGLTNLPPAKSATLWYGYGANPVPEIGGGGAPMGGPVYRYDPNLQSDVKWPAYWDGKAIFGDWGKGQMFSFQLDQATSRSVVDVNRILPGIFDKAAGFAAPMDFKFGPNGALYIIDYGEGYGAANPDSGIYKVNYVLGKPAPIAQASANVTDGAGPLTVTFDSTGSRHPASLPITLRWNFGDGTATSSAAKPVHVYQSNGKYTAQLTVTASDGKTATANVTIVVGNRRPSVVLNFPDNGGFFNFGDQVRYTVTPTDPDGTISCSRVVVATALGHDSHAHPMEVLNGCTGFMQTLSDDGHGADANLFWVVNATYTDDGGAAGVPLDASASGIMQPKVLQSEFFSGTGRLGGTGGSSDGVLTQATGDTAGGGLNIGWIEPNDWWSHAPASLLNISKLTLRAANPNATGVVSVRWGSPTGTELGQISITNTGGWQVYQNFDLTLNQATKPTGSGGLYFVLLNGGINVNWLAVTGVGVSDNVQPTVALTATPLSGTAPLVVNATATASDPDGNSAAIVYTWDKGEGAGLQAGTATQSFTYANAGTYRLKVRATDQGGAYREQFVDVTVTEPTQCFAGRSDGFNGPDLDETRWTTIVRRDQGLVIDTGKLVIPAAKTDIYGGGVGTASNMVLQPMPAGAWQATTKVTFVARDRYQQAGIVLYGDDNNYAKIMLMSRGAASADERVFQFIREENGVPNEVAASNTAALGAAFPDTYYVRLASDGTNLTASYSADGVTFTAMPQTKALAGIVNPKIGVAAWAHESSSAPVINARFDWFTVTPDATATSGSSDEFAGTSVNKCQWSIVRENAAGYRVSGGALRIDTSPFDIYGGATGAQNFVLQNQPSGNWVVETRVDGSSFDRLYQQGGILLWADDDNYVKLDLLSTNAAGSAVSRNLEFRSEIGGVVQNPQQNAASATNGIAYLRLGKTGNVITGWYSADGTTWTQFAQSLTNPGLNSAKIGLFALGSGQQTSVSTAVFDYFRLVP